MRPQCLRARLFWCFPDLFPTVGVRHYIFSRSAVNLPGGLPSKCLAPKGSGRRAPRREHRRMPGQSWWRSGSGSCRGWRSGCGRWRRWRGRSGRLVAGPPGLQIRGPNFDGVFLSDILWGGHPLQRVLSGRKGCIGHKGAVLRLVRHLCSTASLFPLSTKKAASCVMVGVTTPLWRPAFFTKKNTLLRT